MRLMVAIVTDRINEVSQTLIVGLMFVGRGSKLGDGFDMIFNLSLIKF